MDATLVAVFVILGLGLACLAWATLIERHTLVVRRDTLAVLPAGAQPLRVLMVSDMHLAPWQRRKAKRLRRAFARLAAAGEFDLVVNTGDNLGHRDAVPIALDVLAGLRGVVAPSNVASNVATFVGVFVSGSNDHYEPALRNPFTYLAGPSKHSNQRQIDGAALEGGLERAGWHNLNNSSRLLTVAGQPVQFLGVDDHHIGRSSLSHLPVGETPDTRETRETAPDPATTAHDPTTAPAAATTAPAPETITIGVTHAPYLKVVYALGDAGAQVVFAGHTHGGQVAIPGYGALVSNCDLPPRFAKGPSAWRTPRGNTVALCVSAGIGHSIFAPLRFAVRPELRLVTLTARP